MNEFPYGVSIGLALVLLGTCYFIYYILKLASDEIKDDKKI